MYRYMLILVDNVIAVVGISLATSLVTTLVTLAIAYVVHRHFSVKSTKRQLSRDGTELGGVRTSYQVELVRSSGVVRLHDNNII